jgi:hydroxypyruvate isomerase
MNRRTFLSLTGAAAAAASFPRVTRANLPGAKGVRLSCTWGMMRNRPIREGLDLLARNGYEAYEMFDWRNAETLETFVREKPNFPLVCAGLTANRGPTAPGCGLVNPRERENFLKEMTACAEACKRVGSTRLVTLTGNELGGLTRAQQMDNVVAGLRAVAPMLERNGMTAVVEVLNTYVNHAGYFLYKVRDAADMVERVGSPNVKILFDIYHVQIMEGNLIENIRTHIDRIGHFHIGDVPGRHEPGTGEINYRKVYQAIYELGERFPGYAALEYSPLAPLEQDLPVQRKLANF